MPGSMARADLVADLKASLHDAADVFTAASDADFVRHLDKAALDFGRVRPFMKDGQIALESGVATYNAPADLAEFILETWSDACPAQWEPTYPGQIPRIAVVGPAGARKLRFYPAPSAMHLAALGPSFIFFYIAAHAVGDAESDTTIAASDRGLLLLRAQAEALREMAIRNVGKPVQMRDGYSGTPRNGTAAAIWHALMTEFEAAI